MPLPFIPEANTSMLLAAGDDELLGALIVRRHGSAPSSNKQQQQSEFQRSPLVDNDQELLAAAESINSIETVACLSPSEVAVRRTQINSAAVPRPMLISPVDAAQIESSKIVSSLPMHGNAVTSCVPSDHTVQRTRSSRLADSNSLATPSLRSYAPAPIDASMRQIQGQTQAGMVTHAASTAIASVSLIDRDGSVISVGSKADASSSTFSPSRPGSPQPSAFHASATTSTSNSSTTHHDHIATRPSSSQSRSRTSVISISQPQSPNPLEIRSPGSGGRRTVLQRTVTEEIIDVDEDYKLNESVTEQFDAILERARAALAASNSSSFLQADGQPMILPAAAFELVDEIASVPQETASDLQSGSPSASSPAHPRIMQSASFKAPMTRLNVIESEPVQVNKQVKTETFDLRELSTDSVPSVVAEVALPVNMKAITKNLMQDKLPLIPTIPKSIPNSLQVPLLTNVAASSPQIAEAALTMAQKLTLSGASFVGESQEVASESQTQKARPTAVERPMALLQPDLSNLRASRADHAPESAMQIRVHEPVESQDTKLMHVVNSMSRSFEDLKYEHVELLNRHAALINERSAESLLVSRIRSELTLLQQEMTAIRKSEQNPTERKHETSIEEKSNEPPTVSSAPFDNRNECSHCCESRDSKRASSVSTWSGLVTPASPSCIVSATSSRASEVDEHDLAKELGEEREWAVQEESLWSSSWLQHDWRDRYEPITLSPPPLVDPIVFHRRIQDIVPTTSSSVQKQPLSRASSNSVTIEIFQRW